MPDPQGAGYDNKGGTMRRNRLYALAGVVSAVVVAGPAIAATVHSHPVKGKAGAKAARRGPRGPRGRRGARGATGPAGVAGPAGKSGAVFLRTIVVSPSDTTPVANGALLAAAVAAINGAGASAPELVWIEPGTYDLGTTQLSIPSHVDVQGSGQDATTIEGEGLLTLAAASDTEIRGLTVTDTNPSGGAEAIATSGGLRDVTATASGTTAATAVLANAPTMPILDVTASATTSASASSARGLDTQNTVSVDGGSYSAVDEAASSQAAALFAETPTSLSDATLQAEGGSAAYPVDVVGSAATVRIDASTLIGPGGFFVAPGDTLDVGGSQIPGVVASVSGTANCPDDWLANYAGASSNCS
jgi:hypothetical protein